MRIRLDPNERRQLIVEAAMPLFARKGFSGTTTKEIAEAAQVSEGLLFKYFASKTALYEAIINYCGDEPPARFAELEHLPPSSATLAETVHHLVFYFATMKMRNAADQSRQRLFVQSLVEDGEFARMGMAAFSESVLPQLARSLDAAHKAGDMSSTMPPQQAFWLSALLQIMVGSMAMHGDMKPDGIKSTEQWVANVTRFILRGFGLTDEAIARVYMPQNIVTDPIETTMTSRQNTKKLAAEKAITGRLKTAATVA